MRVTVAIYGGGGSRLPCENQQHDATKLAEEHFGLLFYHKRNQAWRCSQFLGGCGYDYASADKCTCSDLVKDMWIRQGCKSIHYVHQGDNMKESRPEDRSHLIGMQ